MFEDLLGNMEQQQAEIANKLAQMAVSESVEGIIISGNANKVVQNISIEPSLLESGDKEMLEDLLISCFNRFVEKAEKIGAEETQKLMETMMPPGFGDLFK